MGRAGALAGAEAHAEQERGGGEPDAVFKVLGGAIGDEHAFDLAAQVGIRAGLEEESGAIGFGEFESGVEGFLQLLPPSSGHSDQIHPFRAG